MRERESTGTTLYAPLRLYSMHTLEATVMDNQTVLQPSVSKRKGYARIQCEPTKRNKRRCEDIYRTIFRGYELLAQQYPEHVTAYTI